MGNKEYWDNLSKPPASALKTIGGGRLKGMTDINPQWRYEVMTDVFGVCGIGWKYTIDKLWNEDAGGGQVFAFASVSLFIKDMAGGGWSDPIPANGGSMLLTQETNKMHSSDEGYKMAITDALGTAMKMLGVASEIYAGRWDGTKYKEPPTEKMASMKTIVQNDLADAPPAERQRLQRHADILSVLFDQENYEQAIVEIKLATAGDPTQVNILRGLGEREHWKKLGVYRLALKASNTKAAQQVAIAKMSAEDKWFPKPPIPPH